MAQSINPVLTLDANNDDRDYTLNDESVWITVGNISVYIKKGDEGVSVDLFSAKAEGDGSIAGTYALYSEAQSEEDHAFDRLISKMAEDKTNFDESLAFVVDFYELSDKQAYSVQYKYMNGGYIA
jgi:hypothetical protein